ncbi:MAG TPA: DegT/DnrJ/EryC1/StrS family aminotransferase [Candidatus Krumholzibacteria bacterium]|nr:DegT/DnrJ/EryC1/StrS family aminotransferase [Candidatus Krumholzibacteria bacterium]
MHDTPVRPKDRFLVFGAPQIEQPEIDEVVDSIRNGWLGTGPKVARFEEAFRRYKGAPYAAAVYSCTAALHLAMVASGVGEGDEVITTPLTFCASVNAIIHTGATPVLADVDPRTMNIDPARIEEKITPRTRALLPVHFAGRPCEMDAIMALAEKHGLMVIEDCAHAIETRYKGREAGLFGDFGCFSFYVTKNVITGEGGMVITADEARAARIKVLALHGMSKDAWKRFSDSGWVHYQVIEAGFKYNMMDIQAAIGIHQLARVEANWERRRQIWEKYDAAFAGFPIGTPTEPDENTRHALHLYTIMVARGRSGIARDDFLSAIQAQNVGVGVHYLSIPEHPYYQQNFAWKPEEYPNAMRIGRETVSLPLSPKLSDADVDDVIEAVRRVLDQ